MFQNIKIFELETTSSLLHLLTFLCVAYCGSLKLIFTSWFIITQSKL